VDSSSARHALWHSRRRAKGPLALEHVHVLLVAIDFIEKLLVVSDLLRSEVEHALDSGVIFRGRRVSSDASTAERLRHRRARGCAERRHNLLQK
jgi:hypothetical protein